VLRAKPVRFAISLIESLSRIFMRLTLPNMSMVITSVPCLKVSYKGERLRCMNNGAWQGARKRAATKYLERFGRQAPWGFEHLRIHDLKHTFGRRLRAARVPFETRQVLLGHKNGSITTHYSGAEIGELIEGVNRIDASRSTPVLTTLRVAYVAPVAPVSGGSAMVKALQSVAEKKLRPPESGLSL